MRLNRLIAERLGVSRRKADEYIKNNRVTINGQIADFSTEISDKSTIEIDSRELPMKPKIVYLLLHKPAGYVCSRNGQGNPTIYDLIPNRYSNTKPAGRLDKDSSGLILMTNDGQLHQYLTHPKFEKIKTYQVTINKPIDKNLAIAISSRGVRLADGLSRLKVTGQADFPTSSLIIHMHEGRNRQIRRTFEALGLKVTSLHRTALGNFSLDDLASGKYKLINQP